MINPMLVTSQLSKNIVGHDSGHVCIYDGQQWISDFVQRTMYPRAGLPQHTTSLRTVQA